MKLFVLCLFMLMSFNLLAFEELWKLDNVFIPLINDVKNQTLVSKNCEKKKCEALKVLKNISFKKLTTGNFDGGKNPGAVLCHSLEGTRIIYLKDLQSNENTFCLFKDNSMVSNSTLMIYAQKNDEGKK